MVKFDGGEEVARRRHGVVVAVLGAILAAVVASVALVGAARVDDRVDLTAVAQDAASALTMRLPAQTSPPGAAISTDAATSTNNTTAPALCSLDEIEVVVTTDWSSYAPGEVVTMRTEATNRAGRDCYLPGAVSYELRHENRVIQGGGVHGDFFGPPPPWPTGTRQDEQWTWDQRIWTLIDGEDDQVEPAPPGRYTIAVTWGASDGRGRTASYPGSATFRIEGKPSTDAAPSEQS